MFLSDQYGINSIEFNSACGSNRYIAFDHIGRPHKTLSNVNDLMTSECRITFYSNARRAVVSILPETGYVKIVSID